MQQMFSVAKAKRQLQLCKEKLIFKPLIPGKRPVVRNPFT
ncbi:hypothetical protein ACVWXS_002010 [Lysinibacillus sp. TE18511]